jgi:MFS family permease
MWSSRVFPFGRTTRFIRSVYCPLESVLSARDALFSLGYTTPHLDHVPSDHLPTLVPRHNWKWKGNHFDPEIPICFELHHCWWDAETNRIHPKGLEEFWTRRCCYVIDDFSFPSLDPVDNLGYTSINLLRHLLKSFPATEQVYGLARFLHHRADDRTFWQRWRDLHDDSLRRLEAISFLLARQWFKCRLAEEAKDEVDRLPQSVQEWFRHFGASTLSTKFDIRKDGLWLHLGLLDSNRDKCAVFLQRVTPLPVRVPTIQSVVGSEDPSPVSPDGALLPRLSRFAARSLPYAKWLGSRGFYHFAPLPLTLMRRVVYQFSRRNLGRQFWTFFAASVCFDFGITMYFFLYNLYLLNYGFDEKSLGFMLSLMNIGAIVCTIPAGILVQRLGIRKSLLICLPILSLVSGARALVSPHSAILVLAFLSGFLTTIWAVAISPAIALLTTAQDRPFGFSVVFSSGIGVGIFANLLASRLPGYIVRFSAAGSEVQAKRIVLLLASVIVTGAIIPLSRLNIQDPPSPKRRIFPRNPFLLRFLLALALWSIVTGSLSPLANVYFSQYLHTPIARIGVVYSFSSLLQVLGILVAPMLFRRLGLVSGIAFTQLAAALLLGSLAATSAAVPAAVVYVAFTGFLWMTEPGMFSLLMNGVSPEERPGASALNFLVISLVQAGAVAATGASFAAFGYPRVLAVLALLAALTAVAFRSLWGRELAHTAKPAHASLQV